MHFQNKAARQGAAMQYTHSHCNPTRKALNSQFNEVCHSSKGVIPGNGLIECGAIIRRGRKVIIHRESFLTWVTA